MEMKTPHMYTELHRQKENSEILKMCAFDLCFYKLAITLGLSLLAIANEFPIYYISLYFKLINKNNLALNLLDKSSNEQFTSSSIFLFLFIFFKRSLEQLAFPRGFSSGKSELRSLPSQSTGSRRKTMRYITRKKGKKSCMFIYELETKNYDSNFGFWGGVICFCIRA